MRPRIVAVALGPLATTLLVGACGAFGSSTESTPIPNDAAGDAAVDVGVDSVADGGTDVVLDSGPHIVFVSSTTFPGNEVSDAKCASAIAGTPLAGRYFRAWLS